MRATCFLLFVTVGTGALLAHDGPDPLAEWNFDRRSFRDGRLLARIGPDAPFPGEPEIVEDALGVSWMFDGKTQRVVLAGDLETARPYLPIEQFTVSAWVSVNTPRAYGGLLGAIQDNGEAEKGWVLGYDDSHFYLALSTVGADDGDGNMTYLVGATRYEVGRLYYVVGTYDGEEMRLYVNGALDATGRAQSGAILYPTRAEFVLGGYKDRNEDFPHHGRLRRLSLYDRAARVEWVAREFELERELATLEPHVGIDPELRVDVLPFLQYVTRTGISIVWRTSRPTRAVVRYGETVESLVEKTVSDLAMIHTVRLEELKPETQYFYSVSVTDSEGRSIEGEVFTFQTASLERTPFAFAILSDTQNNPAVAGRLAELAWGQRPNFVLHPGDLVGTGSSHAEWTDEFFPSLHPLISRVALFPVLGNHEQNARYYYDYMDLPEPEYHYDFQYGNAHFFMVDTNKKVGPGSEQYRWLDQALGTSRATWKFVCHHHPPYSSDENDYGDLWKGKSSRGDLRVRPLAELYDRHRVDIVFTGHIHSYERTWPVADGKAVDSGGTVYLITGGGGGKFEDPGPTRPFFQNNVWHGHHYCMVAINGQVLELKAMDVEGRVFDRLSLDKR